MTALDLPQMEGAEQALDAWFTDTYARHFDKIRRRCVYLLRDDELAEEMAQDAFLRLWRARIEGRYDGANDEAFLARVATNRCFDEQRRGRRSARAGGQFVYWHRLEGEGLALNTDGEWDEAAIHPAFKSAVTPEHVYLETEFCAELRAALLRLPPGYSAVLAMRAAEVTNDEIAAILGISRAAVRGLLLRARDALSKVLHWGRPEVRERWVEPCIRHRIGRTGRESYIVARKAAGATRYIGSFCSRDEARAALEAHVRQERQEASDASA